MTHGCTRYVAVSFVEKKCLKKQLSELILLQLKWEFFASMVAALVARCPSG